MPSNSGQTALSRCQMRHGTQRFWITINDTIRQNIRKPHSNHDLTDLGDRGDFPCRWRNGVMNIMLVSVTGTDPWNRVVNMASGRAPGDILRQFPYRSHLSVFVAEPRHCFVLLNWRGVCSNGGSFKMIYSTTSIVAAFACSTLIGVLFGFLPARNAAQLNPCWRISQRVITPWIQKYFNRHFSLRSCAIAVAWLWESLLLSGCSSLMRSDFRTACIGDSRNSGKNSTVNEQVKVDPGGSSFISLSSNKLVAAKALSTNNDLTLATLTLRKARLQAGLTRDDLYPNYQPILALPIINTDGGDATKVIKPTCLSVIGWICGVSVGQYHQAQWAALARAPKIGKASTKAQWRPLHPFALADRDILNQRVDLSQRA